MTHIRSLRSALARPLLSRVRGGRESSGGLLSPTAAGRLGAVLFLAAATATAVSLATPAAQDHHRLAHVLVSVASGLAGLVAWHSPWRRWPPAAMRWTLAPAALVLIAATNHYGGLHHYSYELAYLLVFAWVGVTQPRWTSLGLAAPLAAAYLLPLLAAGRPSSELFVAGVVVPGVVAFGEGCGWVGSRLRAAECALRAAEAGIERLLEATTALGRAETEAEVAALTADLVMDLLGADRVQVMATEEQGSSRFVNRGQRNMPVPVGEVVIDAATEPSGTALAVHNGRTVFISDARSSSVISARLVRMVPSASAAFIPLPGEGGFLGAIVVLWDTPRAGLDPFSQRAAEVLSVETGQALERTRATARLARDLGEHRQTESHLRRERSFLELLQGVAVAANEARTVDEGVQRALDEVCAYTSWPVGHAYLPNPEGVLVSSSLWHMDDPERFDPFRLVTEQVRFGPGVGLLGRVVLSKEPVWVPDITIDGTFPRAAAARDAGLQAALGVPVVVAGEVVAVLEFFWLEVVEPDQSLLELARHVGTQLGRVVERRRSEATLQASEERARAVIETAGDAFIGMDDNGLVTAWNRQAEVTFGWARHEVLGQPLADLIIPEHLRARHRAGLKHFQETGEEAILGRRLDVSARRRDGREFPVELSVWATRIGSSFGFSAFARDISDRQRLKDELVHQALHDPLTGLPNRTLLLDRLGHALARGERSRAPVTVLFLDLDRFKKINDSLGHAAGDRLLAAVAERLLSVVRTQDTIARLGGDEFAVLLEEMGTVDGVHVAVRVGTALDQPFVIDGHHVLAPASVGIASGNPGEHTADDLLRNADLAMYMAKSKGKARYAVYESEMHVALVERLELEADLRRAVGMAHFFLLFQPVVRLADGSVVGMEALIRWKRAGGAVVSPDQFISVAEEIGLIGEIGRWVLQEACIQAAAWQAEHRPTPALRLSVNLSARQLQDPGLVKDVEAVLAASGLDPACLVIEITESLLMSEPDVAIQRLGDLKDLGVQLAIDDFGTGYSSLSYLRRFPVDVLKVDRSFVTALGRDPDDAALTHAIVKLGQTLHLRVVAEGIETAEELAELRALGCEYGQGYLFARPLTAEAMSAVLDNAGQGRTLLPPGTPDGAFPREAVPGMVR